MARDMCPVVGLCFDRWLQTDWLILAPDWKQSVASSRSVTAASASGRSLSWRFDRPLSTCVVDGLGQKPIRQVRIESMVAAKPRGGAMPFDWGEKLLDLVCGGAPGLLKVLPATLRRQTSERLKDFNPFATIGANEDLLRAVRLAWIEAALEVDAVVLRMSSNGEWLDATGKTNAFSLVLRNTLRALRHEACNRNVHPASTAIDAHVDDVLIHVPDVIRSATGPRPGDVLTRRFVPTLAAVTGWPEAEVPTLYARLADDGLPLEGRLSSRSFGELTFSAFAEIIKNPNRYPEANVAFGVAINGMARDLAKATLGGIEGIDTKIDALLYELSALPDRDEGLEAYLNRVDALVTRRWAEMATHVARIEDKVDASAGVLQQILAAVTAQGQVGPGQHQLAHDTVLALARRFKPDELLDFDRAVTELEFAVGVALQVMTQGGVQGEHPDRFVDEVVLRVAELTAAGRLEQGVTAIDNALVELDRREAEQREDRRRQRAGLHEAAIRQAILLRDVDRVTKAVTGLAETDAPEKSATSDAFERRLKAFYDEGRDKGVNFSLTIAVALARLRSVSAETPAEKGEALVWLGNALAILGQRESGTVRLEEAIHAYWAALEERKRECVPLDWATTLNNLGNVLLTHGGRESGTARLEEALQAYRAALEERTRERVPLDWAMTQTNLSNALATLGRRDGGTARLEEAIQTYRAALEECTRERVPLDWAATQNNLGNALAILGQRESGTVRLEEAVQAYRAALEERTRERVPLDWATTQSNLGAALQTLGQREGGTARLEEALEALRAALEERTRERAPLHWATTQTHVGAVLTLLGQEASDTARLEEAVETYRAALEERTRERAPLDWAMTQRNLGAALQTLGQLEGDKKRVEEAIEAYRAALEEATRERVPLDWAATQSNLGTALETLGRCESGTARLEEAVQAYRACLEERTRERVPLAWAATQRNLGNALQILGRSESGTARLEEAMQAYCAARTVFAQESWPEQHAAISAEGVTVERLIEERRGGT